MGTTRTGSEGHVPQALQAHSPPAASASARCVRTAFTGNGHRETAITYPELGVEVRRSSLNTPRRKRARTGFRMPIVEAGDGLFTTRSFKYGEHILDYRYVHGIRREGDEVDWLSYTDYIERYPLRDGTHVLRPNNSHYYYDTARSGGVGGKANTRPRGQTGQWRGYNLLAGTKGGKRGLRPGDEIFVPYGRDYNLGTDDPAIEDEVQGWIFVRRGRNTGGGHPSNPTPRPKATPAPPRGGEGGNLLYRGVRVFQHALGVSAPT